MSTSVSAQLKTQTALLKLSGKLLSDDAFVSDLCALAMRFTQKNIALIVIHGGGQQVDETLAALGHSSEKIDGLRITSKAQMPAIAGVLAGAINKRMVAQMQQQGLLVCGLSLLDGDLIQARKHNNSALGQVAEVGAGTGTLLQALQQINITPIIASIAAIDGELYNVNADDAALAIAGSIAPDYLFLLSDVEGVYDAHNNLIAEINADVFHALKKSGVIHGGMIAKLDAAFAAATLKGKPVQIFGAQALRRWLDTGADINEQSQLGTRILPAV